MSDVEQSSQAECVEHIRSDPAKERAQRVDKNCPGCCCEHHTVGAFGSPGIVAHDEILYRVIVAPTDLSDGQIFHHSLTQAESGGLSVLRSSADDQEFIRVARQRLEAGEDRRIVGVAEFSCRPIRELVAEQGDVGRREGHRLFGVYDSDVDQLPNHADIFQTMPNCESKTKSRNVRADERRLLSGMVYRKVIAASDFRGGILAALQAP